jgi:hypothetical protein
VPALVVKPAGERPPQRAAVGRLGVAVAGVARVERDHGPPHAQFLAARAVVVLRVVAGVGEDRVERDELAACRTAGAKSGESWLGPTPGTAPTIRWEAVCTTAVSFGQAR